MGITTLVIATICYIITAGDNIRQRDYPHAFIWFAYAMANCGFLWYEFTKVKNN